MSTNRLSLNAFVPSLLILLGACATHQDHLANNRDLANDTQVQVIQPESKEEISLLPRDLSLMTLAERNEKELLQNLENELRSEELRMPATVPTTSNVYKYPYSAPIALSAEEMTQLLFNADSVFVQKGDSLSVLAERHLGNKKEWNRIWALNPNISNPNLVEIGAKVYIPKEAMRALASTSPAKAPTAPSVAANVSAPTANASTTVAALPAPTSPVKSVETKTAKEIPQLKPEVKAKPASTAKSFATEKVPTPDKANEKATEIKVKAELNETPLSFNENSFHSKEELLQEHVNTKNQSKNMAKNAPEKIERAIASTSEEVKEGEAATTAAVPKNLTRIVGFMGFALFLAVMGGFFFSKPNKNS